MPTLSFKDRVVSVALTRARELGFSTVSCAVQNLANSTAAIAAHAGLDCCVFIPADLKPVKFWARSTVLPDGSAGQLRSSQPALLRSRHTVGVLSTLTCALLFRRLKTLGYEVAEQLGWQLPDHIVAPPSGPCSPKSTKVSGIYSSRSRYRKECPFQRRSGSCSPIAKPIGKTATSSSRSNRTRSPSLLRLATQLMVSMRLRARKLMAVLNQSMMLKLLMASSSWLKPKASLPKQLVARRLQC